MRARSGLLLAAVVAGLVFAGIALAADDPPTPVIEGDPRVGETLTASGATIFKWQRCDPGTDPCAADASQHASGWQNISGQQSDPSTYTLTLADAGMMIRVLGKDTVEGTKFGPSSPVGPVAAPPGSITVTKDLVPDGDGGVFDLRVDDAVVADDASDGDSGTASNLSPGTYTVSELAGTGTSLGDYDSSVQCTGEGDAQSGTSLNVTVSAGENVECTITNTREASITVTKDLVPDGDGGVFDLRVDDAVVADDASDGDSGTASNLSPGTYTVSELAGTGTSLGDYDSSVQCTGEGDAQSGTSLNVTVSAGENVECTITNTREASITVTKDLVPDGDGGVFDLRVDDAVVADDASDGDSGTASNLSPGTYTVSELAGTGTSLGDYDSSVQCTGEGDAQSGTSLNVTVSAGENVECTITNTREASITVTKDLVPDGDGGVFDLRVDDAVVADDASDGDSGTASNLSPGTYTVSELAGTGTSLGDYDSSVQCTGEGDAQSGTSLNVTVSAGENVECTITNTREASITVTKDLVPDGDGGVFDLRVDDAVVADDASDGDSGTASNLSPGTYTVSELAGTGTSLGDYDSSVQCTGEGDAQSGTSLNVTVSAGENVECTITNTREASITVTKDLVPDGDGGVFDLRVDDAVVADDASDGDSGTASNLSPGTYTVSELAGTGTSLGDYDSSVQCTGEGDAQSGTSLNVTVSAGENVECTITNTREASITVTKDLVPDGDGGVFDLRVDDAVVADDASDGDSGTASNLSPGTYTVSELAGTGTSLGDYDSSVQCTGEGDAQSGTSLNVTVSAGENVECTITNTREASITVTKDLVPDGDGGVFDLRVDDAVVADDASDGDSGTASNLSPGTYTVSELAGTGTSLGDYDSSVQCTGEGDAQSGTSLNVTVSAGENVECTITNTREASPPGEEPVGPVVPPPPGGGPLSPSFQRTANLEPLEGIVLIKLPGSNEWVEIQEVTTVPMGTKVDVSNGHVLLVTQKKPSGGLQSIELWAGAFVLQQKRKRNITVLTLASSFAGAAQSRAGAETAGRRGKRRLWGSGKCRCRHRGRNSSGTSRGTKWLTAERPKGTLTKVKKGKVEVRDFKRRKKVLVKAGEKYLAHR